MITSQMCFYPLDFGPPGGGKHSNPGWEESEGGVGGVTLKEDERQGRSRRAEHIPPPVNKSVLGEGDSLQITCGQSHLPLALGITGADTQYLIVTRRSRGAKRASLHAAEWR